MKAKIFEEVAKNSLQQQMYIHLALNKEKENLVQSYESQIKDLRIRLEEKRMIELKNSEHIAQSEEFAEMKQELLQAKAKLIKYKSSL